MRAHTQDQFSNDNQFVQINLNKTSLSDLYYD